MRRFRAKSAGLVGIPTRTAASATAQHVSQAEILDHLCELLKAGDAPIEWRFE